MTSMKTPLESAQLPKSEQIWTFVAPLLLLEKQTLFCTHLASSHQSLSFHWWNDMIRHCCFFGWWPGCDVAKPKSLLSVFRWMKPVKQRQIQRPDHPDFKNCFLGYQTSPTMIMVVFFLLRHPLFWPPWGVLSLCLNIIKSSGKVPTVAYLPSVAQPGNFLHQWESVVWFWQA